MEYDEQQEYLPEINAFERVGAGRSSLATMIASGGTYAELQKKTMLFNRTPAEQLTLSFGVAQGLLEKNNIHIDEREMDKILKQTEKDPTIRYKNPLLYLMGYYCQTNTGTNYKKCVKILGKGELTRYQPTDLVRYIHLWSTF
jgi:hypothetical protein